MQGLYIVSFLTESMPFLLFTYHTSLPHSLPPRKVCAVQHASGRVRVQGDMESF